MRCPQCGARNPASADWCTQCYTPLREGPATPDPAPREPTGGDLDDDRPQSPPHDTPESAAPPATAEPDEPDAMTVLPDAPDGTDMGAGNVTTEAGGRFRRVDDALEWRCAVCDAWNPIEVHECTVCGTGFEETVGDGADDTELRDVDPATAVLASALLPGLGHLLLGKFGAGTVRLATFVLWLIGGLLLMRGALSAQQSVLPALPLLTGALVLWLVTANDTAVLVGLVQGRELLTPRVFLWLVVGVVGMLLMSFIPAVVRVGTPSSTATGPVDLFHQARWWA